MHCTPEPSHRTSLAKTAITSLILISISSIGTAGCQSDRGSPSSGSLVGTVTDRLTEEPVAGAEVSTDPPSVTSTTDNEGSYVLAEVPEGEYTVFVEVVRYETGQAEHILVEPETQATADILLERELSTSCAKCHLDIALIQADLEANPLPDEGGEEEASAGEG